MRLNAEKERIKMYRNVANSNNGIGMYYKVCKRLSMANLETHKMALFIMDYMKNVIENGYEYTKEHLFEIFKILTR